MRRKKPPARKPKPRHPAGSVTGPHLAAVLDIGERRVQQLTRDGVLVRVARGRYNLNASQAAYATYLAEKGPRAEAERKPSGLTEESTLLKREQRIAMARRNAVARGELIPVALFESQLGELYASTRREFQAPLKLDGELVCPHCGAPNRFEAQLQEWWRKWVSERLERISGGTNGHHASGAASGAAGGDGSGEGPGAAAGGANAAPDAQPVG